VLVSHDLPVVPSVLRRWFWKVRQLSKTVEQIKKGNPCEKADALRTIHSGLGRLPSTSTVDAHVPIVPESQGETIGYQEITRRNNRSWNSLLQRTNLMHLVLVEAVVSSLEVQHAHFLTLEP
jgi:hypothetical protein